MLNRDSNGRLANQNNIAKDTKKLPDLFQDFVAQVSIGICVTNEDGRILLWNAAVERMTGRLGDITLGNFIWDVYFSLLSPEMKNPNTLDHLQAEFLSFLTSGTSDTQGHKIELDFIHQNGTRFKLLEDVFAVQTAKGHCLFSILHDEALRFPVEDALKASEEEFRNVVEQAGDGIIVLNAQEEILEWNDGCEKISGIDRERALDMRLSDVMPQLFQEAGLTLAEPEETFHHQALRYLELIAQTGSSRVIEWGVQHRYGKQKWVQAVIFPVRVSETLLFGIIARDITLIKQAEKHLQRYNRQLETLRQAGLEISSELSLDTLIWMIASRGVELLNGTAMALYLHNSEKDILELAISLGDNQPELEKLAHRGVGLAGRIWETGKCVLLEDFHTGRTDALSRSYWGKVAGVPLIWGNEFLGVVFVFSDRKFYESDLKILELFGSHAATSIRNARLHHQLNQLAITDPLTGIYNRRHFFEMAEKEFHQAVRYNNSLSVIMFDLDLFKKLNDTYGHAQGDEILQKVVLRCAVQMRDADILGRYGGEEFVAALPQTNAEDALALAERLRQILATHPIELESAKVPVTASFGIATLMAGATDLLMLLNRADEALYYAKQTGRNKAILWNPDIHNELT